MLELQTRAPAGAAGPEGPVAGRLVLSFERRQKLRQRALTDCGELALLRLPRGEPLRDGERLRALDGRIVQVVAAPERLMQVECADALALARAAYHLGNRHVPLEVQPGRLRLAPDHVLAAMLRGLGARVSELEAAFNPENGAYGAHAAHAHAPEAAHDRAPEPGPGDAGRLEGGGPRIHEYRS
jgi:urease accessory protein